MLKKLVLSLLSLLMTISVGFVHNQVKVNASYDDSVVELESDNSYIRRVQVTDENGITHILEMNYETMVLIIDGESIELTVTEVEGPQNRATIDYSTALNVSGKIPWKESYSLLRLAIDLAVGGVSSSVLDLITSRIIDEVEERALESLPDIYFSFTQYRSIEEYYSSYHGSYYNKYINKNITFRLWSATGSVLAGPYDGGWFDPIRP